MIERVEIDVARQIGRAQQRLDLGSEIQPAVDRRIVQRLDADAVAREKQRLRSGIPDRQAEHAAQPRDGVAPPLLVCVDDRFRVGGRVEPVPVRLELGAQLVVVVDLAVEHDPDGAILVVNRLMPGREVDDAQAAHPKRHLLVHPHALIVRSAVADDVAHPVDERAAGVQGERDGGGRRLDETGYAAHGRITERKREKGKGKRRRKKYEPMSCLLILCSGCRAAFNRDGTFLAADNKARAEQRAGDPRLRAKVEMEIGNEARQPEVERAPDRRADERSVDERHAGDTAIVADATEEHPGIGFELGDPPGASRAKNGFGNDQPIGRRLALDAQAHGLMQRPGFSPYRHDFGRPHRVARVEAEYTDNPERRDA